MQRKENLFDVTKVAGEPVSRILCAARRASDSHRDAQRGAAIIPLGPGSLRDSSSLPEGRSHILSNAAYGPGQPSPPIWPCSTRGFPCPGCCHPGGGLLPHLFTLTKCRSTKTGKLHGFPQACRRGASRTGGLFSVALSVAAFPAASFRPQNLRDRPPGVTRRVAPSWPALASSPRPESGLSSRPLQAPKNPERAGDHPAHPLLSLYLRLGRTPKTGPRLANIALRGVSSRVLQNG